MQTYTVDVGLLQYRPGGVVSSLKRRNFIIIVLSLGTLVAALMTWSVIERYLDAGRKVGIEFKVDDEGLWIAAIGEGQPADQAGLKVGDLIVKINGEEVHSLTDYDECARKFRMGHPVTMTLDRGGRTLQIELRPGVSLTWFPVFLISLTVMAYFLLGVVGFMQGPEDIRARLLFGFSLAVAIEMAIPEFNYGPPVARTVVGLVFFLISGIEMVLELHLASVIPEYPPWLRKRPWIMRILYVLGLGFGFIAALTFAMEALGFSWWPLNTPALYHVMDVILFPLWALGLVFLLGSQAIRYPTAQGRHQAGLVLVGVFPWAIYALAGTVYPGFYTAIAEYNDVILSIILLFYPAAVFLAIFRYRLFDLERVVRRGLVYFTMSFILVAVFLLVFNVGAWILTWVGLEKGRLWLTSGAMLLLGMLFSPVHAMVQQAVEKRFFPERSALRQQLIELTGELPSYGNLPGMGHALVHQLREIFEVESVTLLIKRPGTRVFSPLASTLRERELEDSTIHMIPDTFPGLKVLRTTRRPVPLRLMKKKNAEFARMLSGMGQALALPLMQKDELIGVFLIGERISGGRFPAEELELLNLLSHHVATSFENARLFESATYESLTGLLRREPVLAQLRQEITRAERYDRPLSVAMADLDLFKEINDTYGHLSGDALLRRVAMAMRSCLRATDVLGRYGGEEFLLVFPETTLDEAEVVAEKIRAEVADIRLKDSKGEYFGTTVSIGLSSFESREEDVVPEVRDLIHQADEALYRAKSAGRNCVRKNS